jgi:hypothetical protein
MILILNIDPGVCSRMKIKSALITFFLAFAFSVSSLAHGNHAKHATGWLGTLGAAFNAAEAFKHGAVIYDQATGPREERSWPVLVGNTVIFAGHLFQAYIQTCEGKPVRKAITIPVLLAASAATSVDLLVDGITTREYWDKTLSVAKVAVNLIAPVCTILNVHSLYSIATRA